MTTQRVNEKSLGNKEQLDGRDLPFKDKRKFLQKHLQKGKSRRDPSDEGFRMFQKRSMDQNCKLNTHAGCIKNPKIVKCETLTFAKFAKILCIDK